jgi:L-malate glycosyltransferase
MRIAFVWDNFGPLHADRIAEVAAHEQGRFEPVGIELFSSSDTYDWETPALGSFRKITLFAGQGWKTVSALRMAFGIARACQEERCHAVFLCHYQINGILLAAILLRLLGKIVFTMGCSKFDDYPRHPWREWAKTLFYRPYRGAIGSPRRSIDYLRFLGVPAARIEPGYNTVSHTRIRAMADSSGEAEPGYADRAFLCVARLVPKKNLAMLLEAHALYARKSPAPRRLILCGSGPLEMALRQTARDLGTADMVDFRGFVQAVGVARLMRDALCLILPSREEQFGNVVPEAQAVDCPVLISIACGAADGLVRTGINGHIFEPDNPQGLALHMARLGSDPDHWAELRQGVANLRGPGDTAAFAAAVARLLARSGFRPAI